MDKLNKFILMALAVVALVLAGGCKDEVLPTFEPPGWRAVENPEFTATMIFIVQLPADIVPYYSESDEIAAFIGDECRATGKMVDGAFYLLVKGTPYEQRDIVFKYYRSRDKFLYESTVGVPFEIDGVYGTADNPEILQLRIINR